MWLPLVCPTPGTWPTTQACALTGNQIGDPLVCRPVLNPLSYTSQGQAPLSRSCTFKIPSKLSPRRTEHTVPSLRKGQTLSCPLLALTCRSFRQANKRPQHSIASPPVDPCYTSPGCGKWPVPVSLLPWGFPVSVIPLEHSPRVGEVQSPSLEEAYLCFVTQTNRTLRGQGTPRVPIL